MEEEELNSNADKRENNLGRRGRSTRTTKGLKKRQYSPSIKGKKVVKRRKKVTFSPTVEKVNDESDTDSVQDSLNDLVAAAASKFTSGEGTLQDINDLVTQSCQLASRRRNTAKLLEPPQTSGLSFTNNNPQSSPSPTPSTTTSVFSLPPSSSPIVTRSMSLMPSYTSPATSRNVRDFSSRLPAFSPRAQVSSPDISLTHPPREEGEIDSDEEELLRPVALKPTSIKSIQQERELHRKYVYTWGILDFNTDIKYQSPFLSNSMGALQVSAQPAFLSNQYPEIMATQNKFLVRDGRSYLNYEPFFISESEAEYQRRWEGYKFWSAKLAQAGGNASEIAISKNFDLTKYLLWAIEVGMIDMAQRLGGDCVTSGLFALANAQRAAVGRLRILAIARDKGWPIAQKVELAENRSPSMAGDVILEEVLRKELKTQKPVEFNKKKRGPGSYSGRFHSVYAEKSGGQRSWDQNSGPKRFGKQYQHDHFSNTGNTNHQGEKLSFKHKSPSVCHGCGEAGHFVYFCPKNPAGSNYKPPVSAAPH